MHWEFHLKPLKCLRIELMELCQDSRNTPVSNYDIEMVLMAFVILFLLKAFLVYPRTIMYHIEVMLSNGNYLWYIENKILFVFHKLHSYSDKYRERQNVLHHNAITIESLCNGIHPPSVSPGTNIIATGSIMSQKKVVSTILPVFNLNHWRKLICC